MMSINFKPRPVDGLWVNDPDGAYIFAVGPFVQVVIKGPMPHTPGEYEQAVKKLHPEVSLKQVVALPCGGIDALRMGFISLHFG
jgi:hypothetical protein